MASKKKLENAPPAFSLRGGFVAACGLQGGPRKANLGPRWPSLGPSWAYTVGLGKPIWGQGGPAWGHLGPFLPLQLALPILWPFLGHLGDIVGPSWAIAEPSRAILGLPGAILGPSWGQLGHIWIYLEAVLLPCLVSTTTTTYYHYQHHYHCAAAAAAVV